VSLLALGALGLPSALGAPVLLPAQSPQLPVFPPRARHSAFQVFRRTAYVTADHCQNQQNRQREQDRDAGSHQGLLLCDRLSDMALMALLLDTMVLSLL
jgi:hypothetical protein